VRSLSLITHIDLPKDATGPVHRFQWSPSSAHLLVAIGERIDVFSVWDGSSHAAISHVSAPGTRPIAVGFAASDREIFVCSSLGLKFSLHDITTSKTVEFGNPKFSTPATARNGFSFRPRTNHLAFLTRVSGKDTISLHDVGERQILRSWFPDTVDAQRLEWSPDGTWLVLSDSAAHGHKIIFHTADGHLFKTWTGQKASGADNEDFALSNGVKGMQFSADAKILAVADSSRQITVLDMKAVTSKLQLMHPTKIEPSETLQVSNRDPFETIP
jgi:WD40 repeat protein